MNELETNQTQSEQPLPLIKNQTESTPINLCEGYLVDLLTKLHLCNTCEHHKYRNQTKPWLKKSE